MASRTTLSRFSPLVHSARTHLRSSTRPHPQTAIATATATSTSTTTTSPSSSPLAGRLFSSSPLSRAFKVPPPPARPPPPATSTSTSTTSPARPPKSRVETQPHYRLTFTCSPCNTQSTHNISKQGYHRGSVLVTCPGCRNRHVIADHLNIFSDRHFTVEDLMREKGQLVKKGTLGEDGDIEFWEDDADASPAGAGASASQDGFSLAGQPQQQGGSSTAS